MNRLANIRESLDVPKFLRCNAAVGGKEKDLLSVNPKGSARTIQVSRITHSSSTST